jgi:type II secretory pathway pseudopilin PulG
VNRYAIIVGALLLAILAAWGSRERKWQKEVEQLTSQKQVISDQLAIQKTENSSLRKESETQETIEPVLVGGQVAYVTKRTSRTIETAMKQATEQIARLNSQITDLQVKLSSKESETVKSAPFWNVTGGWHAISGSYTVGAGVNLGPISLTLENPVLPLALEPGVRVMLRF